MIPDGALMFIKHKLIPSILIALTLLVTTYPPTPAQAALSIASITPNHVVNDVPNALTISGEDFAPEALVKVGGSDVSTSTALVTNRLSGTELLANLPKDFPPGVYTVYVVNPDSTASLPAGLTVVAPTPAPTSTPQPFLRPQITVKSYSINVSAIKYGQNFILSATLENRGSAPATGIQVRFTSPVLLMLKNGGVISVGDLDKAAVVNLSQTMTAGTPLSGSTLTTVEMQVSYYDGSGTAYSDTFSLNLKTAETYSGAAAPTSTPTDVHVPRLVISDYKTDIDPLEPGSPFTLELTIKNDGDLAANSIIMIVGGGSVASGNGGTPAAGGISGSSGDFSNFAPVGSSNVQTIGNLSTQASLTATQQMIVNVNTNPGVYPIKIGFSYTDPEGRPVLDEQVITLLVYRLPRVEVDFYQPVSDFYTFQANLLPIQIINIGRNPAVLSNLTVTSQAGMVDNGQLFIGYLESGGYITLDAFLTPELAGPAEIQVSVDYTDDFNQLRTITKTITVNVIEMMVEPSLDPVDPANNQVPDAGNAETFWHKIWRFIKGLFGLDSSPPVETAPGEIIPEPVPAPGYKPGKG